MADAVTHLICSAAEEETGAGSVSQRCRVAAASPVCVATTRAKIYRRHGSHRLWTGLRWVIQVATAGASHVGGSGGHGTSSVSVVVRSPSVACIAVASIAAAATTTTATDGSATPTEPPAAVGRRPRRWRVWAGGVGAPEAGSRPNKNSRALASSAPLSCGCAMLELGWSWDRAGYELGYQLGVSRAVTQIGVRCHQLLKLVTSGTC